MTIVLIFFNRWTSKPSRADHDIWIRSSKDGIHYEYIAVYGDGLAICMKNPPSLLWYSHGSIQAQAQRHWTTQLSSWLWI